MCPPLVDRTLSAGAQGRRFAKFCRFSVSVAHVRVAKGAKGAREVKVPYSLPWPPNTIGRTPNCVAVSETNVAKPARADHRLAICST
jgi:hypothetical protein